MVARLASVLALGVLLIAGCAPAPSSAPRAEAPAPAQGTAAPAQRAAEAGRTTDAAKPAEAAKPPAVAAAPTSAPAGAVVGGAGAPAVAAAPVPARAAQAPAGPTPPSAEAKPAAESGTAAQPLPELPSIGRMIIYTTDLTLLVRSVTDALAEIGNLAVAQGGYLAGVENSVENGVPVSTVRIKVLPERYQAAMSALRGLAVEVPSEKATTQDVTEEYSDVQTQIASLEATHRQLLELLAKASTVDEIMKIQTQANQIKLQIDRLKGRATVLERLSGLATITIRLQPAEAALAKDYVTVRTQLRQAQTAQAAQLLALQRAKTPEEENAIRDKLGELGLQIDRASARLKEIETKAAQAGLTLPTAVAEDATAVAPAGKDLPQQYIEARVQLRRALVRQDDLTRQLKYPSLPEEDRTRLQRELSDAILEVTSQNVKLKTLAERAGQVGVTLPTLTAEQEAALAGVSAESAVDPWRLVSNAWEASLVFLRAVVSGLLAAVVFLWWVILLVVVLSVTLARTGGWRRFARRRRQSSARTIEGAATPPNQAV